MRSVRSRTFFLLAAGLGDLESESLVERRLMYSQAFHYRRAATLAEASRWLAEDDGARAIAGGQSLVPLMKLRLASPSLLVDLGSIPGLNVIRAANGSICLGPMARHAEIARSELAGRIPLLRDCAAGIADVQVRNMGTIGGSVAEADPSGDWPTALLALNTEVRCSSPAGDRAMPLAEFITDAFTTALAPGELVSELIVRAPGGGHGSAYTAFKRTAPVYATVNTAVALQVDPAGRCQEARIVLGCIALRPLRARGAEAILTGQALSESTVAAAATAAADAAEPPADTRGSTEYKRLLIRALVLRSLRAAWARSRGEHAEISHEYAAR
ncbi:MAG: FAD binding domain-containing protein [Terriglobales bacterium]